MNTELTPEFWSTAEHYIGTKELDAIPMTLGEYNMLRGWDIPENESPENPGYIVRYEDGYVSWSPEMQFDSAYCHNGNLSFGDAVYLMKDGKKMTRDGWNGKDMFIFLVNGSNFEVSRPPLLGIYPEGTQISYHAHIDMKTVQGYIVPWLASQVDVLANDWSIVDVV